MRLPTRQDGVENLDKVYSKNQNFNSKGSGSKNTQQPSDD